MARILFATYEFHPTTWGGCGVLLRHATDLLLQQGHEVVLLLDVPKVYFDRFEKDDLPTLSVPERCRAHHADALCEDAPSLLAEVENPFLAKSLRFAHAVRRLAELDPVDFVEFFEYCGVGYHALVEKRFGLQPRMPVLGMRVHNSVELIDLHEGTHGIDRDRSILYGLERAGLALSEATLLPSQSYADAYYLDRYELDPTAIRISEPPTARFPARPILAPGDVREVQFFGRIFEFKGVERLVRAALLLLERQPDLDVDFVFIGNDGRDGPGGASYTEYLLGTIPERFRNRFEFTGHLPHDQVAERFGRARVTVFPNRFESFCYAAHEAHEAGVPLLMADIPAFRNYFEEGVHAWYFDGSSTDLADQIGTLLENPERLAGLEKGTPLATAPLGDFYERPRALRPIARETEVRLYVTTIVEVPLAATEPQIEATVGAVRAQMEEGDRLLLAYHDEDPRAPEAASGVRWLGATRRVASANGEPAALASVRTQDALWLLVAGDHPDDDFLALCRGALERNPSMGFAGTWFRDFEGRLVISALDLVPERYPFDFGARRSRALIRTRPETLLVELFDSQAGHYGEVGVLWRAQVDYGRGSLLAQARLTASSAEEEIREPGQLAFLVQAAAPGAIRERLSLLALSEDGERPAAVPAPALDEARARRIASDHLNGTTLLRMAWTKLRRKLLGRAVSRSGR
ncbi:MAG: glycosyltransferase family 4 protein [bacterium]|nr:glycosyltransferase family 4 protein [bacterium]